MANPRYTHSLTLVTAGLILLIAALTGGTLVILRRLQRQAVTRTAAYRVLESGRIITTHLSRHPELAASEDQDPDWHSFRRMVESIHAMEDALQYVSVSRDNVVLFHQQAQTLDPAPDTVPDHHATDSTADIRLYPRVVQSGDDRIPVVVFSRDLPAGDDGPPYRVDVALRQAAVWREGRGATQALGAMFRLSILALVVSFGCCLLLMVWMMRREARRERQRRAEEHLAFSGVLANGIVHDFRNPMSAMRLDVQMLNREIARQGEARPERIATLAERVRGTLDRMDSVFEEFLSMSRPANDRIEAIPLRACLEACMQILTPRAERSGVSVALREDDAGLAVAAHPNALRRALLNILINAEQWSPQGGQVTIRIRREGALARLDIDDNGPGIPVRQRDRVFEIFYSTRPEGTGLGLFLAAQTIERAGGSIHVEAKSGPGTRMVVRLPLHKGKDMA